jgi:putative Holliday junction resolvase
MRILAVDYGRRRVGLAVSDELGLAGRGLPTIQAGSQSSAVDSVAQVASDVGAAALLVGLPLNMDGSRGPMAEAAEAFATALNRTTGLPVRLWDERLTTVAARRAIREIGARDRKTKGLVDRMAAVLLLNNYLLAQDSAEP